jgi:hypothetical protein
MLLLYLHIGQLSDLMHILEEAGLPSPGYQLSPLQKLKQKYIFNGDFVDRGMQGVEVTALLLALFCAFPGRCIGL